MNQRAQELHLEAPAVAVADSSQPHRQVARVTRHHGLCICSRAGNAPSGFPPLGSPPAAGRVPEGVRFAAATAM